MRNIIKLAALLSLLLTLQLSLAQESASVSVIGSGIGNALLRALAEQAEQAPLDLRTVGTAAGIDQFCNGDIDLATAIRPMSGAEKAICGANDIAYSELLIAHRILAFVAHPDAPLECLTESQAQAILKPSASGLATDWTFSGDDENDTPLSLILPPDGEIEFVIADDLVPGDGLRRDARAYENTADALAIVGETEGALALVGWHESLLEIDSLALLAFDSGELGECALPSAENVEQEQYSAAISLIVYVNRPRMASNPRVSELLQFVTDQANQALIRLNDATPPSEATYDLNSRVLMNEAAAVDAADFQPPGGLSGSLRIVGAASAVDVLDLAATALTQVNESLAINLDFAGKANGIAALCAGEADIALLDARLIDNDLAACSASDIATRPITLGSQATVLIGNAADKHTRCLTTDQVNTIWRAESAKLVTNWSAVDPTFPDLAMTLFGWTLLDQSTDILLQTAGDVIPPIRRDTEIDYNPLYRAAAVGNVPGALTYVNWSDYQRVIEGNQANIQPVAVDAGAGCVTPAPSTIEDDSYALSRPATLLIRQRALTDINTQSYLWTLFGADNWHNVEREGFVGLSSLELPAVRLELQRSFAEAQARYPDAADSAADVATQDDESTAADEG